MNESLNGIVKVSDNKTMLTADKPAGFIVREKVIDENKSRYEFGTYIDNDTFFSISMNYSLKSALIPINSVEPNNDGYKYYNIPDNKQYAIGSYMNTRSGKLSPSLTVPNEKNPAQFIACIVYRDNLNKILNVKTGENVVVVRKYIDPERNVVAFILLHIGSENIINPKMSCTINYGKDGGTTCQSAEYMFDPTIPAGHTVTSDISTTSGNKIEFIMLPDLFYKRRNNSKNNGGDANNKDGNNGRNDVYYDRRHTGRNTRKNNDNNHRRSNNDNNKGYEE